MIKWTLFSVTGENTLDLCLTTSAPKCQCWTHLTCFIFKSVSHFIILIAICENSIIVHHSYRLHNQQGIITPVCACNTAVLIVLLSALLFPKSFTLST